VNPEDYRELLGMGASQEDQIYRFYNRLEAKMSGRVLWSEEYLNYCFHCGYYPSIETCCGGGYEEGVEVSYLLLQGKSQGGLLFQEVLFRLSSLVNSMEDAIKRNEIYDGIIDCIKASKVKIELIEDNDGVFFIPSGVKLFDQVLIIDVMEWLKEYPKSRETVSNALKQYAEGEYDRDIVDNMRKALEEFLKEFFENSKNLDNNIAEVGTYLKRNGVATEFTTLFTMVTRQYNNINNEIAKHKDRVIPDVVEYIIYQTGVLMRLLIKIERSIMA